LNQYQQQSNVQNQIPAPAPPAFAKQRADDIPANGRVPAASEAVDVSGAAAVAAPAVQTPPSAYSYDTLSRAKPPTTQTAQEQALLRLRDHAAPGQIGGYVVDPSGAVVSNARVTITPSKPGKPTTAVTDARGEWLIAGLPTGSYKAEAAAPGFATSVLALNYDANQPRMFALTLSPGSVSETVEVAAAAPQLQTETAKVGRTISSNEINQLPVNGRSVTDLSSPLPARWSINAAGALQRSFDQGATWQSVDVGANSALNATSLEVSAKTTKARAKDANKALKREFATLTFRAVSAAGVDVWAGGIGGALFHSQDAGIHWIRIVPSSAGTGLTGDILTLEFPDPQHGRLSTSTSEVWITADAGQTWQKQ
jgi:hypothetical protein